MSASLGVGVSASAMPYKKQNLGVHILRQSPLLRGSRIGSSTIMSRAAHWRWTEKKESGVPYRLGFHDAEYDQILPAATNSNPHGATSAPIGSTSQLPLIKIEHRAIEVGGWIITCVNGPIGNAQEMDHLSDALGVPPPEMVFPHNSLTLRHSGTGSCYSFDAETALKTISGAASEATEKGKCLNPAFEATANPEYLKVSHAKEWGKDKRSGQNRAGSTPKVKDYDWTYSCTWPGLLETTNSEDFVPASNPREDRIPVERLGAGSEPILFFNEMVLYEDELGDNGTSMLSLKIVSGGKSVGA